jgi:hypothetical protein
MKAKKGKKKSGIQNPFALPAKMRKAGPHKNKKDKRAKENHHEDYLDENL